MHLVKQFVTNILFLSVVLVLCQCKKEPERDYPNDRIVMDNAQAALYFHTVFGEAENIWAFIHSMDYESGEYAYPSSTPTMYKKLNYDEDDKTVVIDYNAWVTPNNLTLVGEMTIVFAKDSYRRDAAANVYLSGFSINGQDVVGESTLKYRRVDNSENDNYQFTLLNGAAIFEMGNSMPQMISCAINNGEYVRTEGSETLTQDDDVWAFSGVMTGQLRNNPALKYTNTITATITENGERRDARVFFNNHCATAQKGRSQIKMPGRVSDIIYEYFCSDIYLVHVAHVD